MLLSRKTGVLAVYVVCGALAFGTSSAASATPAAPPAHSVEAIAAAPDPGAAPAAPLINVSRILEGLGGVLNPMSDMLGDVVGTPNQRLTTTEANQYGTRIQEAVSRVRSSDRQQQKVELPSVLVPLQRPGAPNGGASGPAENRALAANEQALIDSVVQAAQSGDSDSLRLAISLLVNTLVRETLSDSATPGTPSSPPQGGPAPQLPPLSGSSPEATQTTQAPELPPLSGEPEASRPAAVPHTSGAPETADATEMPESPPSLGASEDTSETPESPTRPSSPPLR